MSLTLTLALLIPTVALAVFCGWRGAQPPNVVRGPRMIPYRLLMLLSATVAFALVVHLVNLFGITTGPAR